MPRPDSGQSAWFRAAGGAFPATIASLALDDMVPALRVVGCTAPVWLHT